MSGAGAAREQALAVLEMVRRGRQVGDALHERTLGAALSTADRALMAQLVYGVLRHQRYLDAWMAPYVRGPLDAAVQDILRMGFFQIGFLDRIPRYAAVNAAVEQAKQVKPRAAGLVNAVLRRGSDHPPDNLPLALRYSHPDWLVSRWAARYGPRLESILAADNQIPPLTLRVNLTRTDREAVMAALSALGVAAEPSRYVPEAIRIQGSLWLEDFPPFQQGLVTVQDESGMLVAWVLDPQPGDHILDMAAGVGGKTGHVLERMAGRGTVTAADLSAHRLDLLRENLTRLGLWDQVAVSGPVDAVGLGSTFPRRFDKVILDAPCSGLGVLRRRVDARWRKAEADLPGFHQTQMALVGAAIETLKAGGVIVYSACSTEPEETTWVIDEALATWPGLAVESVASRLPHPALEEYVKDGLLLLAPGDLGMDGFFIARLRWKGEGAVE